MPWIRADNAHDAIAPNDFTIAAYFFY